MNVKQVIVMRHDLGMRRGKQIAQGSHASMAFLSRRVQSGNLKLNPAMEFWLDESFAKICVRVDSEEALMEVYDKAIEAELEVHLVTDAGRTEFHGVSTRTCLAIGPAESDRIDVITGDLKLL